MARRSRRQRDDQDDHEDDSGSRRGRRGGRRGGGGGGGATIAIVGVVAVVVLIGGYFAMNSGGGGGGMSEEQRRRAAEKKRREKEDEGQGNSDYKEPDANEIQMRGSTPEAKVGSLLFEAKRLASEQKNLAKAEEALKMGLEIGPDFKGDLYHCMGHIQTEYAAAMEFKGSKLGEYWDKKLEWYRKAKEAYGDAGAKTTYNESPSERAGRMETLIKMGERQKGHDVQK